MKSTLSFILLIFISSFAFAQSPDLMSYQAVVRNANGTLISEKPVGIRIRILQKTDVGNSVYIETHSANTNKNGLVTIKIGGGTVVSGSISKVDWSKGPYFLQTEIDPAGGSAYSINNVSQMLSVPYALYAKSSGTNGWGLKGNAISDSDFIGTTNDQPILFKANNLRVGYLDGGTNIFWGQDAGLNNGGGYNNVGIGNLSLYANKGGYNNSAIGNLSLYKNTEGYNNVANGSLALYSNTTGIDNVANGVRSLLTNTTGYGNSAIGAYSLYNNETGYYNTANGYESLNINTTGYENTANGYNSLFNNTTGLFNTATGSQSLFKNSSGYFNTATGYQSLNLTTTSFGNTADGIISLYHNTTGSRNVGEGGYSLYTNTVGSNNSALGYGADVSVGNLDNATALGYGAIVNASNKVRIGNSDVTVIEGQVAFSFPSDARFKYNIQHNVPGLDFIKKLQPVTYYFDNEKLDDYTKTGVINNNKIYPASYKGEKEIHTGFLAQDVEKIANELGYHFDGVRAPQNDKDHYSLAYSQFIMPLVKGMQEQQVIIEKQNKIIENQNEMINELGRKINQQNEMNDEQNYKNNQQDKSIDKLNSSIKNLELKIEKMSEK